MVRDIKRIIVHCSGTTDGTFESIKKFHTDPPPLGRGWDDIGYHALITRDGVIHNGRLPEVIGAHCLEENYDSLGVCMVGIDTFTMIQIHSLLECCKIWMHQFGLTHRSIYGHYEFISAQDQKKTCPGFKIDVFRAIMVSQVHI